MDVGGMASESLWGMTLKNLLPVFLGHILLPPHCTLYIKIKKYTKPCNEYSLTCHLVLSLLS